MSRISTTSETTVEIHEDISCFIAEPETPDESFEDNDPLSTELWVADTIFQLKLPECVTTSATTQIELVRDQGSNLFCRKVLFALAKVRNQDHTSPKDTFATKKRDSSAERLTSTVPHSILSRFLSYKVCYKPPPILTQQVMQ